MQIYAQKQITVSFLLSKGGYQQHSCPLSPFQKEIRKGRHQTFSVCNRIKQLLGFLTSQSFYFPEKIIRGCCDLTKQRMLLGEYIYSKLDSSSSSRRSSSEVQLSNPSLAFLFLFDIKGVETVFIFKLPLFSLHHSPKLRELE